MDNVELLKIPLLEPNKLKNIKLSFFKIYFYILIREQYAK